MTGNSVPHTIRRTQENLDIDYGKRFIQPSLSPTPVPGSGSGSSPGVSPTRLDVPGLDRSVTELFRRDHLLEEPDTEDLVKRTMDLLNPWRRVRAVTLPLPGIRGDDDTFGSSFSPNLISKNGGSDRKLHGIEIPMFRESRPEDGLRGDLESTFSSSFPPSHDPFDWRRERSESLRYEKTSTPFRSQPRAIIGQKMGGSPGHVGNGSDGSPIGKVSPGHENHENGEELDSRGRSRSSSFENQANWSDLNPNNSSDQWRNQADRYGFGSVRGQSGSQWPRGVSNASHYLGHSLAPTPIPRKYPNNMLSGGYLLSPISPYAAHPVYRSRYMYQDPPSMGSLFGDRRWASPLTRAHDMSDPIEEAAHRNRHMAPFSEAKCTWSGNLVTRVHKMPTYSSKVFLGGVPWDITEDGLKEVFANYGNIRVQWPGKEARAQSFNSSNPTQRAGYVYIVFDGDKQVKALLNNCTHDYSNGGKWYFNISSRKMRCKEVQIIPWIVGDSNFVRCPAQRIDHSKTVFVGALHGMLTAEGLATIMNDLFSGVIYVGIDTDKYKYPIGSGRVTFSNCRSFHKAVQAAFIEIKSSRFNKKIQVDPYLENAVCSSCNMQSGPIFCRDESCFRYFCRSCWQWVHSVDSFKHHRILMRNKRDNN